MSHRTDVLFGTARSFLLHDRNSTVVAERTARSFLLHDRNNTTVAERRPLHLMNTRHISILCLRVYFWMTCFNIRCGVSGPEENSIDTSVSSLVRSTNLTAPHPPSCSSSSFTHACKHARMHALIHEYCICIPRTRRPKKRLMVSLPPSPSLSLSMPC